MTDVVDRTYAGQLLEHAGLDAVVATSPEHVFLLSGYGTWLERKLRGWMLEPDGGSSPAAGFAVLTRGLDTGLVVSPLLRREAARVSPAAIRPREGRGLLRAHERLPALVALIEDLNLADGRLGIELAGAPAWLRDRLAEVLPNAALRDCSVLLRLSRMKKSDEALRRVRDVARATEEALEETFPDDSPPASPEHGFRESLARRGADFDHLVFGIPGGGVAPAAAAPRTAAGGVYVDAGAQLDWFHSDTGLTLGRPAPAGSGARGSFDRALEAFRAGAAALRPGTPTSAVYGAMQDVIGADPGLRAQGHGLGIDIRELPLMSGWTAGVLQDETITLGVDLTLDVGMVVNLEVSGFYDDESLQIEATFVITPLGAEPAVEQRRDRPWSDPWRGAGA